MVYVTPKQEPLSEVDRAIIGPPRIITIPLENRQMLTKIGDMLKGLGNDMMFQAGMENTSTRDCALYLQYRIDMINREIRKMAEMNDVRMPRRGRKKAETQEQDGDKNETILPIPFRQAAKPRR